MSSVIHDVRFSLRALRRNTAFALWAVLALALGIGANTAVFTVVNSVLLRPLRYQDPARLCLIHGNLGGPMASFLGDPEFLEIRDHSKTFESVAAFSPGATSLTGLGEPTPVNGWIVTPELFHVLRENAALGRVFRPEEGDASRNHVVVLSDAFWRGHFNGDPSVVGKRVKLLDGDEYEIIGVTPRGFAFPAQAEVWTPLTIKIDPHIGWLRHAIGRLRDGATIDQAGAETRVLIESASSGQRGVKAKGTAGVTPLQDFVVGGTRASLLVLLGAVGFILLISCANVANLLLARGASREQEISVRVSLGASRRRIVRQLLTEGLVLSFIGSACGLLLAAWIVSAMASFVPKGMLPRFEEVNLDGPVLLFTLLLSIVTTAVFGVAPAVRASRLTLGSRSFTPGGTRLKNGLVVVEIALAMVLLAGAGLMVKSFVLLRSVDPGFRSGGVTLMTVDLPENLYQTNAELLAFHQRALGQLSAVPGVSSSGAVNWLPLDSALVRGTFGAESRPAAATNFNVSKPGVTPGYFRTMGIRLLAGRDFDARDSENAPGVAIVSRSVAQHVWPGENALGKRLTLEDDPKPEDWLTVIGMVDDVKQQSLSEQAAAPAIYQPLPQVKRPFFLAHMAYVFRTPSDPSTLAAGLRARMREIAPDQPIQLIEPMEDLLNLSIAEPRFYSSMLAAFSGLALLLAGAGIYGVIAYSVTQRTREIGVRMALGAKPGDIFRSVVGGGAVMIASGVGLGLAGSLALTRVLRGFLFEVTPTDAATLISAASLLTLVALLASYLPARRAMEVDPMVALRYE